MCTIISIFLLLVCDSMDVFNTNFEGSKYLFNMNTCRNRHFYFSITCLCPDVT
jgi:hypothetical protein